LKISIFQNSNIPGFQHLLRGGRGPRGGLKNPPQRRGKRKEKREKRKEKREKRKEKRKKKKEKREKS